MRVVTEEEHVDDRMDRGRLVRFQLSGVAVHRGGAMLPRIVVVGK